MGIDDAPAEWTTALTDEIDEMARQHHPADVPYFVAARVLGEVGMLLHSRGVDADLIAQLDAAQDYLTSIEGPAPLSYLPERRHDPRPRGDSRWRDVEIRVTMAVQDHAWREAAGSRVDRPRDVELAHDIASYLRDHLRRDPAICRAGARVNALPVITIAEPPAEGPA